MELTLIDITDTMSDWDQHWSAIRNCLNIYVKGKYYGFSTEDYKVVSAEDLKDVMHTIVDKVKAFFKWLWEKLTAFFGKIKKFVLYIWNKIKEWLGLKKNDAHAFQNMCRSCTLSASPNGTIHYYYDTDTCGNILREYLDRRFPVCKYHIVVGSTDDRAH